MKMDLKKIHYGGRDMIKQTEIRVHWQTCEHMNEASATLIATHFLNC
jgi:hypothetical protein